VEPRPDPVRRGLHRRALAVDAASALTGPRRALRWIVAAALLASLIVPPPTVDPQERIVSKRDADRIFRLSRSQWEDEATRLVQSEGWKVQPGSNDAGTGVITFDPKTGVGLGVRPSFRDAQGPPETLVVGSYYPAGTFRQLTEQTRRELEATTGSDLGLAYTLTVSFSIMTSPAPGFDVVEILITRARR